MTSISMLEINDQSVEEQIMMVGFKLNNIITEVDTSLINDCVDHGFAKIIRSLVQCRDMGEDNFCLSPKDGGLHGESWTSVSRSHDEHDDKCIPSVRSTCFTDASISSLSEDASTDAAQDVLQNIFRKVSEHTANNAIFKTLCSTFTSIIRGELTRHQLSNENVHGDSVLDMYREFIEMCGYLITNSNFLLGKCDVFEAVELPWNTASSLGNSKQERVISVFRNVISNLETRCTDASAPDFRLVLMHYLLALADLKHGEKYRGLLITNPPLLDLGYPERDGERDEKGSSDGSTEGDVSDSGENSLMAGDYIVSLVKKSPNQDVLGLNAHMNLGRLATLDVGVTDSSNGLDQSWDGGDVAHTILAEILSDNGGVGHDEVGEPLRLPGDFPSPSSYISVSDDISCQTGTQPEPRALMGDPQLRVVHQGNGVLVCDVESGEPVTPHFTVSCCGTEAPLVGTSLNEQHVFALGSDLRIGGGGDTVIVPQPHTSQRSTMIDTPGPDLRIGGSSDASDTLPHAMESTMPLADALTNMVSSDISSHVRVKYAIVPPTGPTVRKSASLKAVGKPPAAAVGKPPAVNDDEEHSTLIAVYTNSDDDIPPLACDVDSDVSPPICYDSESDDDIKESIAKSRYTSAQAALLPGITARAVSSGVSVQGPSVSSVSSVSSSGDETDRKRMRPDKLGSSIAKLQGRGNAPRPHLPIAESRFRDSEERVQTHHLHSDEWLEGLQKLSEDTLASGDQLTNDPLLRKAMVIVYHLNRFVLQSKVTSHRLMDELASAVNEVRAWTNVYDVDSFELSLQRLELMKNKVTQLKAQATRAAIHVGDCDSELTTAIADVDVIRRWMGNTQSTVAANKLIMTSQLRVNNESRLNVQIEGLGSSCMVGGMTFNSMEGHMSTHMAGALGVASTQSSGSRLYGSRVSRVDLSGALQAQAHADAKRDAEQVERENAVGMSTGVASKDCSEALHKQSSFTSRFQAELDKEGLSCDSRNRLVQSPVHMASPGGGDSVWMPPSSHASSHTMSSPDNNETISMLEVQQICADYGWSWLYDITPPSADVSSMLTGLSVPAYEQNCLNFLGMAHLLDPELRDESRRSNVFHSIQSLKGIAARGRANPSVLHPSTGGTGSNDTGMCSGMRPDTATSADDDSSLYEFRGGTHMLKRFSYIPFGTTTRTSATSLPASTACAPPYGGPASDTESDMWSDSGSESNHSGVGHGCGSVYNGTMGDTGEGARATTEGIGSSSKLRQDLLKLFRLHTDTKSPDKVQQLEANLAKNFSDEKVNDLIKDPNTPHSVRVFLTRGVPETLLRAESVAGHQLCSEIHWDSGASLHITDFLSSLVEVMELLDPIKVNGIGADVAATHTGFDPRWTGRFSFLSGGAGICVFSVGEACRPDQNGREGFFLFSNEGAFSARITDEIRVLLRLLNAAARRDKDYAQANKSHNVYIQKCTPEAHARAQAMLNASIQERADVTALAALIERRSIDLAAVLASQSPSSPEFLACATSAKVGMSAIATTTTTPANRRSVAGGGGSVGRPSGPIAKASVFMMRANVDDLVSQTSTEGTPVISSSLVSQAGPEGTLAVTSSANLRKRRVNGFDASVSSSSGCPEEVVTSREEKDEARSSRAARRNSSDDRGDYVYDTRKATMVWSDFKERKSSCVSPKVPAYYADAVAADEKFYSSVTKSSSPSLSRQGGKSASRNATVSHRHVTGGGSSWTSTYTSVAPSSLADSASTGAQLVDDKWTYPFPMHLRTSVCGAIRNSQLEREDAQYVRVKSRQGPIDPNNLSVRTNLKEYTIASWNRPGHYGSADFANDDHSATSGEVRLIFQQSNLLHEMEVWEDWKGSNNECYSRDWKNCTSILQNWESSECGRTFPLREGGGRSPAEFLRARTLSHTASCRAESVLVGGDCARRMESVVRQYDLHKAQSCHMQTDSGVVIPPSVARGEKSLNALGADFDTALWNGQPSLALLVEMTHCLSYYKQELLLAIHLTHPGWLDLVLPNELAETILHLQIMSVIGLRAIECLKRHHRYIIMMEQVIGIIERHGSMLGPDCYHNLIPSLGGELGPATVCYRSWPGITQGINNLMDTAGSLRDHALLEASVSMSRADMGIYAESKLSVGNMNLVDQIDVHEVLLVVYSELGMAQGRSRELPPEHFALNDSIIRHFCRTAPHVDGVMQRFAGLVDILVRFGPYIDEHHNRQKSPAESLQMFETAACEKINDSPAYAATVTDVVTGRVLMWNAEKDRQMAVTQMELLDAPMATDAGGHVMDPIVYNTIIERVYTNELSEHSCSSSSASDESLNIANFMGGSLLSLEHMVVKSIVKLATPESVMPVILQIIRRLKHMVGQYSKSHPQYNLRAMALLDMPHSCGVASKPLATYRDVLEFFRTNGNNSPTHKDVTDTLVQSLKTTLADEINFLNRQVLDSLLMRCYTAVNVGGVGSEGSVDGASERPLIDSSATASHSHVAGRVAGGGLHNPTHGCPISDAHSIVTNSAGSGERVLMLRTGERTPKIVYCCKGFVNDFMTSQVRGGCSNGCCDWGQLHTMMMAKGYSLQLSPEELRRESIGAHFKAQASGLKSGGSPSSSDAKACAGTESKGIETLGDSCDPDEFRSSLIIFLAQHLDMTPDKQALLESSVTRKVSDQLIDLMNGMKVVNGDPSDKSSQCCSEVIHHGDGSSTLIADIHSDLYGAEESMGTRLGNATEDARGRSPSDLARLEYNDQVEASYEDQAEVEAAQLAYLVESRERQADEHILSEECYQAHVDVEEMISASQAFLDEHAADTHRKVDATYAHYHSLLLRRASGNDLPAHDVTSQAILPQAQLLDFSYRGMFDEVSSWLPNTLWVLYSEYTAGSVGEALRLSLHLEFPAWDERLLGYIHMTRGMVMRGVFDMHLLARIIERERDYRVQFSSAELLTKHLQHLGDFEMLWILSTLHSIMNPWEGFMNVAKVGSGGLRVDRVSMEEHLLLIEQTYSVYCLSYEQKYLIFIIQWTYMNFGECMHDISTKDWDRMVMGVSIRDLPKDLQVILHGEIRKFWEFAHGEDRAGRKASKSFLPRRFGTYFLSMSR